MRDDILTLLTTDSLLHCSTASSFCVRPGVLLTMSVVRPVTRSLRLSSRARCSSVSSRVAFIAQRRGLQDGPRHQAQPVPAEPESTQYSNPQLAFPCLDTTELRTQSLSKRSMLGPEPSYTSGQHEKFHSAEPLLLDWGGVLPSFDIAYESWGTLNSDKSNAILLHTGLSASSHAHSTEANPKPGWWEKFIVFRVVTSGRAMRYGGVVYLGRGGVP